tara:strand:- start:3223 stop:4158 length:936 start_codon:yes stop_codon:yes gene_type:complete
MENFVTLFNNIFLPQGLALHFSMERHMRNYNLWVLCVDDDTYNVLEKLSLPNTRLLKLSNLETKELLLVKSERSVAEYCWTLSSFAPRYVFEADKSIERVTYLDADLWFIKNPKLIFDEFDKSGKQVLITEHAYAPEYDQSEKFGKFCVQFLTFTRNGGEKVRKCWESQCLEWCFSRVEDGKFGDQKYLDDWPERFNSLVHVLNNKGSALAPWNASRYAYSGAIFYHFHGLKIVSKEKLQIGSYSLSTSLIQNVYQPYSKDLKQAVNLLESIRFSWCAQAKIPNIFKRFYYLLRYVRGVSQTLFPFNYIKW